MRTTVYALSTTMQTTEDIPDATTSNTATPLPTTDDLVNTGASLSTVMQTTKNMTDMPTTLQTTTMQSSKVTKSPGTEFNTTKGNMETAKSLKVASTVQNTSDKPFVTTRMETRTTLKTSDRTGTKMQSTTQTIIAQGKLVRYHLCVPFVLLCHKFTSIWLSGALSANTDIRSLLHTVIDLQLDFIKLSQLSLHFIYNKCSMSTWEAYWSDHRSCLTWDINMFLVLRSVFYPKYSCRCKLWVSNTTCTYTAAFTFLLCWHKYCSNSLLHHAWIDKFRSYLLLKANTFLKLHCYILCHAWFYCYGLSRAGRNELHSPDAIC